MLNDVWLKYCKNLNQFEEILIPIINENIVIISSLNFHGKLFFSDIMDDIHILIVAKIKKMIAAIKNNLILEKTDIKKILSNPNAPNHK